MPDKRRVRVLMALRDDEAIACAEAYLRSRRDCILLREDEPYSVNALRSGLSAEPVDLLLLEADPGSMSGEAEGRDPLGDLIATSKRLQPALCLVLVISPDPQLAFRAAQLGAVEILTLPLDRLQLALKLDRVIEQLTETGRPHDPRPAVLSNPEPAEFPNSFLTSRRMAEVRSTIEKVATTSATVLIRGESGVGKEIVARMIFARSDRSQKPFVKLNCAAIPNELLESELFGFEAGAFTGAQRAKPGKFEIANGGTMFLDEIGEMHPMLQAKLLHVLQDGEFSRLGSKHDTSVDVRVICATNKLLEQRVADGLFREDLFYRINVVTIHIPPLRERTEEIPLLLDYFIAKYSSVYKRAVTPLDEAMVQFLMTYTWPGNIRELENLCKRYVIVGGAAQIIRELTARHPDQSRRAGDELKDAIVERATPAHTLLEIGRAAAWKAEREAIREMLTLTQWNRKEAARRLQVSYKALLNKVYRMEKEGTEWNVDAT